MKLRIILIMAVVLVVVGVSYLVFGRGRAIDSAAEPEPRQFVWAIDFEELAGIAISLPYEGKGEAWVRKDDKYWYFDQPDGPQVDMRRWGGGIPLILSGPGAERLITHDSTADQLQMYGLRDPRMTIDLLTTSGESLSVAVGDPTPDLQAYYVKTSASGAVFSVDFTWYDVLERLVVDPPYPEPAQE